MVIHVILFSISFNVCLMLGLTLSKCCLYNVEVQHEGYVSLTWHQALKEHLAIESGIRLNVSLSQFVIIQGAIDVLWKPHGTTVVLGLLALELWSSQLNMDTKHLFRFWFGLEYKSASINFDTRWCCFGMNLHYNYYRTSAYKSSILRGFLALEKAIRCD